MDISYADMACTSEFVLNFVKNLVTVTKPNYYLHKCVKQIMYKVNCLHAAVLI